MAASDVCDLDGEGDASELDKEIAKLEAKENPNKVQKSKQIKIVVNIR